MNPYYKIIKDEEILVKIKTKSDIGFWQYQLFGWLSLFMERGHDFFLITEKKVLLIIKDELKFNQEYSDFSKIEFNSKSDIVTFQDVNSNLQKMSLTQLKLDYDDYQYLKQKLKN
ncbi:hypothetical protein [Aurantibacter aestuarii]|uniref:Uncharacterized protein n=1 Tax=Aurantibacter aestuarii TaxID=1266046 RepID=A0A2T1NFV8_9FLAO|nr:hypothetical protein [Aurantibacter aestuarii]PSG91640.1 hypothetical protein C7H52_00570 [Aurantibacter aestuarii]